MRTIAALTLTLTLVLAGCGGVSRPTAPTAETIDRTFTLPQQEPVDEGHHSPVKVKD